MTFAKFAAATLALFLTVGIFLYGIDIKQLGKQIQDTHVESQKLDLDIKRAQLDLEKATDDIKNSVKTAAKSAKDANDTLLRIRNYEENAKKAEEKARRSGAEIEQYKATAFMAFSEGSGPKVSQSAPNPALLEHFVEAKLLETLKDVLSPKQYSALQTRIGAEKRGGLRRQVFDAKNTSDLPGDLVRKEGDAPVSDPVANEAYDNLGVVYHFFKDVFGRESLDNHGKTLVASIHYGQEYNNSFWNGQQMVFGDGDGVIFQRFTAALDVIAIELTKAVTQFTAQLPYQDQPGALNTSMADVFGSMVKQWELGQTVDQADWLIGAAIMAPGFKGRALRDMANPGTAYDDPRLGKDPQPGDMNHYVQTDADNGGVHTNSGIPSRAFVLAAKAIGGHSWEKTGKIWYVTLTERLTANADFAKCATETVSVARDLFPEDPSIAAKVAKAWTDVGVLKEAPATAGSRVKR